MLPNRSLELFVDMAACCVAAAMVGLALSALAKSNEQIMPLLVVAIMSQLVFQGGMIPVTGRIGLDQLSWITPGAVGIRQHRVDDRPDRGSYPGPLTPQDSHWKHTAGAWWFNMAMLAVICVGYRLRPVEAIAAQGLLAATFLSRTLLRGLIRRRLSAHSGTGRQEIT